MYNSEHITTIRNWLGTGAINIFGLPFSGKDSQGRRLASILGGSLVGGGQILRGSVIPPHVQADLDAGILVPTDDYMRIVIPYLSRQEFADKPLLLSAVGRWHGEEDGVVQALQASQHPLRAVISLTISEDEARRRWMEHENQKDRGERSDDSETVLENRFHEFHTKTEPVLAYYRERQLLIEVDGTLSRDDVTNEAILKLAQFAAAH